MVSPACVIERAAALTSHRSRPRSEVQWSSALRWRSISGNVGSYVRTEPAQQRLGELQLAGYARRGLAVAGLDACGELLRIVREEGRRGFDLP